MSELATLVAATDLTMDFDHVDDDLLDGCGFDGNAFFPASVAGGVAEQPRSRFAQPKSEAEIDKA